MMLKFAALSFVVGASALNIPRTTCSFELTASGGQSGTIGQLSDGQLRIGGGYPASTFTIAHGGITDAAGRGCILTPPTSQFQCDAGASPTSGFSIGAKNTVLSSGSSKFFACPASDTEWNVYTVPVPNQYKCVEITLTASGCSAAAPPYPVNSTTTYYPATPTGHVSTTTLPPPISTPHLTTSTIYATSVSTVISCAPTVTDCPAGSTVLTTVTIPISTTVCPVTETAKPTTTEVVPPPYTPEAPVTTTDCVAPPAPVTVTVTVTECPVSSTTPVYLPTKTITVIPPPAPTTYESTTVVVHPTSPPSPPPPSSTTTVIIKTTSSTTLPSPPPPSTTKSYGTAPPYNPTTKPSPPIWHNTTIPAPPPTKPTSTYVLPPPTKPTTTYAAPPATCPTTLVGSPDSGNWQFPHLIVPVSSATPYTAEGTSYFGTVSPTKSSIFNFDIPASYSGKTCSLVFLLPKHEDLETSAYTISGSGSVDFEKLSDVATQGTTYNNTPGVAADLGTYTLTEGSSTVVSTFACPAGSAIAFEAKSVGGTDLHFFQDYNPSPLGLYITTC